MESEIYNKNDKLINVQKQVEDKYNKLIRNKEDKISIRTLEWVLGVINTEVRKCG